MMESRTTVMILVPGRNAISVAMPRAPKAMVLSALLMPLMTGAVAQRYVASLREPGHRAAFASIARASGREGAGVSNAQTNTHVSAARSDATATRVLGMLNDTRAPAPMHRDLVRDLLHDGSAGVTGGLVATPTPAPDPVPEPSTDALAPAAATLAATIMPHPAVIDVKSMLRAINNLRRNTISDAEVQSIPKNGPLRLDALHLGETVTVRPFGDDLQPDPAAMAAIEHAMRCRITGMQVPIDPQLIQVLVQLHALYGKPIQLVSGHRQPHTIGTKKTSQHAAGRAADIRIPGVGIEELKRVAMKLGARGIGLYPEKGFVHIDVRPKARYYWRYIAAVGEQPDTGMTRPPRANRTANSLANEHDNDNASAVQAHGDSEADEELDTESTESEADVGAEPEGGSP